MVGPECQLFLNTHAFVLRRCERAILVKVWIVFTESNMNYMMLPWELGPENWEIEKEILLFNINAV